MEDLEWASGLLTDYVRLLAKEHPTAAQIVQAYCNSKLQQPNTSSTPVPDDGNPEAD